MIKSWQINQLRLGFSTSLSSITPSPTTDCRILLLVLDQESVLLINPSIEMSPCLTEEGIVSDMIRLRLAELYITKGDEVNASRILQDGNKLGLYFLQQSANLVEQGAFTDAQYVLALVAGWSGYASTDLHLSGSIAQGLGDSEKALDIWLQAIELNAYHPDFSTKINRRVTMYEVGKVAANMQEWELARDAFSGVVALNPNDAYGWMRLGLVFLNGFNNLNQAEQALRESLKNGDLDWAHFGLGKTLEAQGRDIEAIDEIIIAFRMTRLLNFRDELLSLIARTENHEHASTACIELFALTPNDVQVLVTCAKIATEVGEIERAIDLYERASILEKNKSWQQSIQILTEQLKK